jgi:hypothetical protein
MAEALFVGVVTNIQEPASTVAEDLADLEKLDGGDYSVILESILAPVKASLRVEEVWRGIFGNDVEVWTGRGGGGDCGVPFKVGERYLVFAYHTSALHRIETDICSGTDLVSKVSDELAYIRRQPQNGPGAKIYGTVDIMGLDVSDPLQHSALKNVPVIATGVGTTIKVYTDQEGQYQIRNLRPGKYEIRTEPPSGFTSEKLEVTFQDTHQCATGSFFVSRGQ